ncbi:hypothetical protein [Calycomorphotria hydatis]|uniref:Uncharacterized protein n=1 Tax=Calycomorphotria hydatis TaxID=2528027 RepID=A0A517T580_9PLAN|nr:hypothetical protein [Calycomorphotria hydatis]QDT63536.1 hypothetical protein V22_07580 [Calycomorphotria hydatis]
MAANDSDGFSWMQFFLGLAVGVGLTFGYVRYGWELPAILQLPGKVGDAAVLTTADMDLYDFDQSLEVRQRALAVVLGRQPDLLMELDEQFEHQMLNELLRRKALRKAQILKQKFDAYDKGLEQPKIRQILERKYREQDTLALKQRMLHADIRDDEFLWRYLEEKFPEQGYEERLETVLTVYQHRFMDSYKLFASEDRLHY